MCEYSCFPQQKKRKTFTKKKHLINQTSEQLRHRATGVFLSPVK